MLKRLENLFFLFTGLDPAHVLFSKSGPDERLDSSHADVVEVIHTTGGYIGFNNPIGLRDFYPNGGKWPQPGCTVDFAGKNNIALLTL